MAKSSLKKQTKNKKLLLRRAIPYALAVAALAALAGGWMAIHQLKYRNFSGTVTRIGLEGSAVDAPVYYQVQVSPKVSQDIYLTVAPTPEHPNGTPLPRVKVGDKVTVHALKGDNNSSLVGAEGTYIKTVQ